MKTFLKTLLLLLAILCLPACGRPELVLKTNSYRFYLKRESPAMKAFAAAMVDEYNRRLGFQAMSIVPLRKDANSYLHFYNENSPESLTLSGEERIGFASPIRTLKESKRYISMNEVNDSQEDIYEHGMTLNFQREYIRDADILNVAKDSKEFLRVFKLFCHEVGHGLLLDHEEDSSAIMYPSILEEFPEESFALYFDQVRSFIQSKH